MCCDLVAANCVNHQWEGRSGGTNITAKIQMFFVSVKSILYDII